MFFPERIKNILPGDKVLEIGPGAAPYERSDVLLEKKFASQQEYEAQFGHTEKLVTEKQIVFYEGDIFPFRDNEFDYVICSHVLEHVENVPLFLSEVFRVGRKGYFEYPNIYYEYLYNFDVHLNFLKFNGDTLFYMNKKNSPLNAFAPVQAFFYESLKKGHVAIINDLLPQMMEGFEWKEKFSAKQTDNVSDLVHRMVQLEAPVPKVNIVHPDYTLTQLVKKIIRKMVR